MEALEGRWGKDWRDLVGRRSGPFIILSVSNISFIYGHLIVSKQVVDVMLFGRICHDMKGLYSRISLIEACHTSCKY